jgi:hypothetical protein
VPDAVVQGTGSFLVLKKEPGAQTAFSDPPNVLPNYDPGDGGTPKQGFDPSAIFGANTKAKQPDTFLPAVSNPAVGDMDQDGVPDLVLSGETLSFVGAITAGSGGRVLVQNLIALFNGRTGSMFDASPIPIEDVTFLVNPTVADVSGDDYPEVLLGTGSYFVHATDACGNEPSGWPKFTHGWLISSVAVGDLDGDHKLEVVAATRQGNVYVWHTNGTDTGVIEWDSYHHDTQNTGYTGHPLGQGVVKKASAPLVCSVPTPQQDQYDAGGCAVGERGRARGAWLVLALAGLAAARRRRLRWYRPRHDLDRVP